MNHADVSRRSLVKGALAAAVASRPAFGFGLGPVGAALPSSIERLIGAMTLEEKAGQLNFVTSSIAGPAALRINPSFSNRTSEQQLASLREGRLTGIFNGAGREWLGRAQRAAMESRLRIPAIFAGDVIHGFNTVFPVPLAEAASFDPSLAERTARVTAEEAATTGIAWTFAPMVDVCRDARWGRTVEGVGEDVLLARRMSAARVRGFQGEGLDRADTMLACPKHFAGYGAVEAGLDYNTVDVSERTLREVYFPPFQAAFEAGALSTMAAFNELSGVPATANRWLLSDVLRGEWHFRGLVVSDYQAVNELVAHGLAKDERDAARRAFLAGMDMDLQGGLFLKHLPDLVRSREVPAARLDEAVRRVLFLKHRLGLFDDPFNRIDTPAARAGAKPLDRALAREAGRRSIVMLKNDGDLLPLRLGGRIAVIGPFAEGKHDLVGPWTLFGTDAQSVDLATGLRGALGAAGQVTVSKGCDVDKPIADGIRQAVAAAMDADVVILAIGEPAGYSGEASSRTEPVIPQAQQELAEAIRATGKPVVVVLKNGRALALQGAVLEAPAILVTWFLGSETGTAIADIVFGTSAPSGRLPVSFPREPGQSPYYYAHKPTGRATTTDQLGSFKTHFQGVPNSARFPFGHGLTYGKVTYADLSTGSGRITRNGQLTVSARVTNVGTRQSEEVVQLYLRDRAASVTRPVRELKDFRRVRLDPGQSEVVQFTLTAGDLRFVGAGGKWTTEPGMFDVWVAPSAEAETPLHGTFELV